jgi:anti-anti-sigma factor
MTRPHFTCGIQRCNSEAIISVAGEFDLDRIDVFDATAALVLADPTVTTVRIDCRSVSFLDCAAVGALVRLQNEADAAGRTVVLEGPPRPMKRLLKLAKTDIPIAESQNTTTW